MAGLRAFFLLTLGHTFSPSAGSELEVFSPPSRKAELGTTVMIPCTFKVHSGPINRQYLAIMWEFQGATIVKYDNKGLDIQARKYIDERHIEEGAADLYIHNSSVSDIGIYKCNIIYSPDRGYKEINLTVYARPSISALEKMNVGHEQYRIACSVTGYYPEQIAVELITDGTVASGSVLSSPHKNNDKTFSINSSVILPSTEKPKSLSCRIRHESLTEPVQRNILLVYNENGGDNTGLVGGVIAAVVILIVLSVIAAVLYKKKSGSSKVVVCKIQGTKMLDGETCTLYCNACNCSPETLVKWVIEHKEGTTCEITEGKTGDKEEEEPLMSTEYKMLTEKVASQKRKSCLDITAKLTFIPSVSRHLGSAVTCKFINDKKSEEQTYELKDINAKPQFMEPVQLTITSKGDVQLSASIGRFYPQPLQISWTSKKGQSQEKVPSDEDVMKNPDATFTLTSKCTVSGDLFKDPTYKVTVTWKHESMDNSQSREISAKDLPWRPQFADYIEDVIRDDEILYKCSVSDYFPDALTVKWFEKNKDCQDFIDVSESEKYTIPNIISSRTDKKTFTATPCLSLKKSILAEKDVVFICRVDHPSLEKPIECKKTAQQRDSEVQSFFVNNIQGPQKWYDGGKVTLYCAASYCTHNTRVIWIVTGKDGTEQEICEDSGDAYKDGGQCPGYTAHRERTDESDIQGLLDVTSCLSFTPSVSKHKYITISCKISCEERVKKKTLQRTRLLAKPKVLTPIRLSLTDSGDVVCALHIEDFYPSDIQIRWNDVENPLSDKPVKNSDGTYTVNSEYKLPGSFFREPQSTVKVSWRHESMDGWEQRQMSAGDKDFPWMPELREIPVPNLFAGITATLKCEVRNVFPDVLSVRWLKKEKDGEDLFPLVHSDKYQISDVIPERQKDNTFTYKGCIKFTPTVSADQGAEFIFRVEHSSLGEAAEKRTGALSIQDLKSSAPSQERSETDSTSPTSQTYSAPPEGIKDLAVTTPQKNYRCFIVGDIRGCDQWTQGDKVTLQCPLSYCSEDVKVLWSVTEGDGKVQEISRAAAQPLRERDALNTSGYFLAEETDESDVEGLSNITSIMTFIPTVRKHHGSLISCTVTSDGETEAKKFQPKSVEAKPQVLDPIRASLTDSGDVICSLTLQNFYPKRITVRWTTEQNPLISKDDLQENADLTYNVCSHCTVLGGHFKDPNFKLRVTWRHKTMTEEGSRVLSWRDVANSFPWRPVIQEVPVPHVLMGQLHTLQYNISGYFPDAVTVSWYKKEKGSLQSVRDKYKTSVTESERQSDSSYSCTASLLITPTLRDAESEIICRVEHPSLETPSERSTGALCVQGKPKNRKPIRVTLDKADVKCSLTLESFYPRDIQITWSCGSDQGTQSCPSTERYYTKMDKSHNVTSDCRISEKDLKNPNFRVHVTWRHESMDDSESRELSIRDKDYPYRPTMHIQVPPLYNNTVASLECTISNYFPDALNGMWFKKDHLSGETHPIPGDGAYSISNQELGRQPNNTYTYKSRLIFTPSVDSDKGAEFIIQVEHPSLEQPMQKSTGALQVADYPYHPIMHIQVPPLYNNTEVSLECTNSNCFPGELNEMWFKKDQLSEEAHHIAGDGAYRISNQDITMEDPIPTKKRKRKSERGEEENYKKGKMLW